MDVQWYPGHMAKARRMMQDQLKLVDIVIEILDARMPAASRNPDFDPLFENKARVVVLNKADIADKAATKAWLAHFSSQGFSAMDAVSTRSSDAKALFRLVDEAARERVDRWAQRGAKKTVRAMVAGIPNVGKSTLINLLTGSSKTAVADRPGVTRGKQWVSVGSYLELLDTPGILWPKQEDGKLARHLAYAGTMNDEIMDIEELCGALLAELAEVCPSALAERYGITAYGVSDFALLEAVARRRGFLRAKGALDTLRAARVVLDEFRAGKLGAITLELPPDEEDMLENR